MRSLPRLRSIGLGLILAGAAWVSLAASPATKVVNAGEVGISLDWDSSWQIEPAGGDAPPNSAQFRTPDGSHMMVMITAGTPPPGADVEAHMKSVADSSAQEFLAQSVEKELPVEAFKNGDTHGYQVCATDRAPKPGEYKYICQGIAAAADKVVVFTVLYNDPGKAQAARALKALQALQIAKST